MYVKLSSKYIIILLVPLINVYVPLIVDIMYFMITHKKTCRVSARLSQKHYDALVTICGMRESTLSSFLEKAIQAAYKKLPEAGVIAFKKANREVKPIEEDMTKYDMNTGY